MRKIVMLIVFLVFLLPTVVLSREHNRKYLKIGTDPVCWNCPLQEGEETRVLPDDVFVQVRGGSGRLYSGWLRKGEKVVVRKTNDSFCGFAECYVAVRVRKCGNPLVGVTSPEGPKRILFISRKEPAPSSQPPSVLPEAPIFKEPAPSSQPPAVIHESLPPTSLPQPPVQPAPSVRCPPAVPVIAGALGSTAGLLARNGLTGALLGVAGGVLGNLFGSAMMHCQSTPLDYMEAGVIGGLGGALWGKSFYHKKTIKVISPSNPAPLGVRTGGVIIH